MFGKGMIKDTILITGIRDTSTNTVMPEGRLFLTVNN